MKIFRFEKWFADVMFSERDYFIVFHTLLEVLGIRICFVEINISRFSEENKFHLNRKLKIFKRSGHTVSTKQGYIMYEEGKGGLKLSLGDMEVDLNFAPVQSSNFNRKGMIIRNRGGGDLEWKPLYLKARVSGRIRISVEGFQAMEEEPLTGTGYVDYLKSTMSPFSVPVQQLFWGRMHSRDLDLSYSYVLGKDRNKAGPYGQEALEIEEDVSGAKMMVQTLGETFWFDEFTVQAGEWKDFEPPGISCPVSYTVKARSQRMNLVLKVIHLKPAVVSEFTKNPKEMGRFSLALLQRISKEPAGIKFYSFANLEFELDGQIKKLNEVLMIDEYVRFK